MEPARISVEYTVPDRFWKFISEALEDLEACEANPAYQIDMEHWHTPSPHGNGCSVCLAGAVIANRLDIPPYRKCGPAYFKDDRLQDALRTLDILRDGNVRDAIYLFHSYGAPEAADDAIDDVEVISDEYCWYNISPEQFKAWMRKAIDILKKHDV